MSWLSHVLVITRGHSVKLKLCHTQILQLQNTSLHRDILPNALIISNNNIGMGFDIQSHFGSGLLKFVKLRSQINPLSDILFMVSV